MKNKNLLVSSLVGGCVCFVVMILISLLFQRWHFFDSHDSIGEIMIRAAVVSIVVSLTMYFYSKRRLHNRREHKN